MIHNSKPSSTEPDTMVVTFSEVLETYGGKSGDIFNLLKSSVEVTAFNSLESLLHDRAEIEQYSFLIPSGSSFLIKPNSDELQCRPQLPLASYEIPTDFEGNTPEEEGSVVPILIGNQWPWEAYVIINPFVVDSTVLGDDFLSTIEGDVNSNSSAILVETTYPATGWSTILDVVGNTVVSRIDTKKQVGSTRLFLFWDGKNNKGRTVGTGQYAAVIEVNESGKFGRRMLFIGVSK